MNTLLFTDEEIDEYGLTTIIPTDEDIDEILDNYLQGKDTVASVPNSAYNNIFLSCACQNSVVNCNSPSFAPSTVPSTPVSPPGTDFPPSTPSTNSSNFSMADADCC